jgi:hypothetical protein
MNNKILVGSLVLGVVLLGAASITWAASSNYQGWRSMMGTRAPQVTEQNFNRYTEMQKAMVNGDYTAAQTIRTELGLGQGKGGANGTGCAMRNGSGAARGTKAGGCPMANKQTGGTGFVDKNNNGVCDLHENLK